MDLKEPALFRPLFRPAWLAPLTPGVGREEAVAAIDAAERGLETESAAFADAVAVLVAARDTGRIDELLDIEIRQLPEAGKAAWAAVERTMREIAYKRRELMPRFPGLLDRVRDVHEVAVAVCREARWALMAVRALAEPGGPSSPVHGSGTRYVKSVHFDGRAQRALPPDDRVRADRMLKRLGESPVPAELDLRPLAGHGEALWTMRAGGRNRFILRPDRDRRGALFVVEDVGLGA